MILAILVPTLATADIIRRHSVPAAYLGTWGSASGSLTASTYASGDANCSVEGVSKIAGARGSIYSVRLRCRTHNEGHGAVSNLIIRPTGLNEIAAGPEFRTLVKLRRCAPEGCETLQ